MFKVVSKFIVSDSGRGIGTLLHQSISRLGLSSLYGFLAHRPAELLQNPGLWDELQSLKEQGIVEKAGFSLNTTEELEKMLDAGMEPDLIQAPFNYLDTRFREAMVRLKTRGCEIHARSAFLQGLFFANVNKLHSFFDELKPVILSTRKAATDLPGDLLNFVACQPFIDKVVIGVENTGQLIENLQSLDRAGELPERKLKIREELLQPSNWPQKL